MDSSRRNLQRDTDALLARAAELLNAPAQATPIVVNGEKRLFIQANLRPTAAFKKWSDPNGLLSALEITLPFEILA